MDNIDLNQEFHDLLQEVKVGSVAGHDLQVSEFFNIYSELAAENGDTPDLEYCPVLSNSSPQYRVDGYALDLVESADGEFGDLYLVVCDFNQDGQLRSLNAKDIERSVNFVIRFYKNAVTDFFIDLLEEASPAYQLALLIRQYQKRINSVRVIIFTNNHLKMRSNRFETKEVDNIIFHTNVLDLERYAKISYTGSEPVEINFSEDFGGGIKTLVPEFTSDNYSSYLFSLPGSILAEIYSKYGNRLLEQNVRTYLQARTNVNKGILKTISDEPEMFFAYNNGVTATASTVSARDLGNGAMEIMSIGDFQIVNGGQTTASLLYARDGQKRDLSNVHVQVKLSVVDEQQRETIVPKISEYANTQNKVSLADLASNSPAQIRIERLSKENTPPLKAGHLHVEKWFYERSRGQYKNLFAYKTQSERKRLQAEYPRDHLITKTDLAKYEMSFDSEPHLVSMGAQKCFLKYTSKLAKIGSGDAAELNSIWFKRAVAKAILFKSLDTEVQKADWYQEDRGYKSQIVTYTIAACADGFRRKGSQLDLEKIWESQSVSKSLLDWIMEQACKVSSILKNPPPNVRNISEYAKKAHCWETSVSGKVGVPEANILFDFGISIKDFQGETKTGKMEGKRNAELDFDIAITHLVQTAHDIKKLIEESNLASPKNQAAISKLMVGNINLNKGEKNALKNVLDRLGYEY